MPPGSGRVAAAPLPAIVTPLTASVGPLVGCEETDRWNIVAGGSRSSFSCSRLVFGPCPRCRTSRQSRSRMTTSCIRSSQTRSTRSNATTSKTSAAASCWRRPSRACLASSIPIPTTSSPRTLGASRARSRASSAVSAFRSVSRTASSRSSARWSARPPIGPDSKRATRSLRSTARPPRTFKSTRRSDGSKARPARKSVSRSATPARPRSRPSTSPASGCISTPSWATIARATTPGTICSTTTRRSATCASPPSAAIRQRT